MISGEDEGRKGITVISAGARGGSSGFGDFLMFLVKF